MKPLISNSYEAHRNSSDYDLNDKSQEHDFKVHQRSLKTNINKFQRPKRSKQSEAIELQDFEDSSDEEEQKYLNLKQSKSEFKKIQIESKLADPDEPSEFITEPLNRGDYEERQISKKNNTLSQQSNEDLSKLSIYNKLLVEPLMKCQKLQ